MSSSLRIEIHSRIALGRTRALVDYCHHLSTVTTDTAAAAAEAAAAAAAVHPFAGHLLVTTTHMCPPIISPLISLTSRSLLGFHG